MRAKKQRSKVNVVVGGWYERFAVTVQLHRPCKLALLIKVTFSIYLIKSRVCKVTYLIFFLLLGK